jgi:hypothetical protein
VEKSDPLVVSELSMLNHARKPRGTITLPDPSGPRAGKAGTFGVVWNSSDYYR